MLPKLIVPLDLPDPNWVRIPDPVTGGSLNADDYFKEFDVEVEVLQLNLTTQTMRVRFPWPDKSAKNGTAIRTEDLSMEVFNKNYKIIPNEDTI